jgi:hypothetical protein
LLDPFAARVVGVSLRSEGLEEAEMSDALLIPMAAVATGVVVIVVAIAVVLVVLSVRDRVDARPSAAWPEAPRSDSA